MRIRIHGLALLPPSARKPRAVTAACRRALQMEGADLPGEMNVVVVGRSEMLRLNKSFLKRRHDTDVIAFDYAPPLLGDVFVSAYQARRQAREQGHPVLRELLTLAVHGTLHLLGYDDATPRQRARMFKRQDEVLGGQAPARRSRPG